ncbi:metalloprotease TldD [Rhodoligotrophos ferricapiens]|uniref:metalloprotease TldD n=1 Tax=Rhodoligotrophos ferricapiens TaxID=3069264 RepID=UPI00315D3E1E
MSTDMQSLFFSRTDLDRARTESIVSDALTGCDDGELFLEYRQHEGLVFDDGVLRAANFDITQGFGIRAVSGETTGLAHSSEISEAALRRAADAVQQVRHGSGGVLAAPPPGTNRQLYSPDNPVEEIPFTDKVKLLSAIDSYARGLDSKVAQVYASLAGEWQVVEIIRGDGSTSRDIRPLVRLTVSITARHGERQESGSHSVGGRSSYSTFIGETDWRAVVDEAFRQAQVNLEAGPAPAGEMDVVLGPGWPGILLHEAVGHGLEGDFNRKQTSAFAGLMGQRVAAPGVTVVDDGTINDRRGSLTIDDEGTPSAYNVLIEDGILKGYMQDRLNARLMGMAPTGNGRRESHAHVPMPRMTNTYMLNGDRDPAEIIASVKNGLYAVSFGGGQVDITSGKFVFSCTEAYHIENGKIGRPVKGATLIGNGPDALTRIAMIGNDMKLDPGVGTCGKRGQGVPVGVGQPTIRLNAITVGGTG